MYGLKPVPTSPRAAAPVSTIAIKTGGGNGGGEFTTQRPAGATSGSNLYDLRLGFCAICRRQSRMKTQNIEQGLAAHVAQHHTQRESGDRRTKYHQHTYVDSHIGPSI